MLLHRFNKAARGALNSMVWIIRIDCIIECKDVSVKCFIASITQIVVRTAKSYMFAFYYITGTIVEWYFRNVTISDRWFVSNISPRILFLLAIVPKLNKVLLLQWHNNEFIEWIGRSFRFRTVYIILCFFQYIQNVIWVFLFQRYFLSVKLFYFSDL